MKKTLLILMTLFTVVIGYSQQFTENFITYNVTSTTNNTVRTTNYDVAGGPDVVIPSTVTDNSVNPAITYTVTLIGPASFFQKNLTSVVIPNSVTSIGSIAFSENQNLSIATLHNGISSLGDSAFNNCGLTSVNIPTSMTTIENGTFANNNIISVTIPDNITSIGDYAFRFGSLVNVTISDNVTTIGPYAFEYNDINNLVIGNGITSIANNVFGWNDLTNVTIPSTITSIGTQAFRNNQLTSVTIPNSVTTIGDLAFIGSQLTNITIPDSVTNIGSSTFASNPLTGVTSLAITPPTITTGSGDTFDNRNTINLQIPAGTMGAYVTNTGALWTGFNSVTGASSLAIGDTFIVDYMTYEVTSTTPDTVEVIDYDMTGGTIVTIPDTVSNNSTSYSVMSIGDFAFGTKNITSVVLPNNITSIGELSFRNNQLTSITIPNSVTLIKDGAFENNLLTNVFLGNSVFEIEENGFFNNQLTSITIPSSVSFIGPSTFNSNPLTDVTSLATIPPTINTASNPNDTFANNRNTIHLHIPAGTMGAYVTDPGALWTGFNPVTEDAALSVLDFELINEVIVVTTPNELNVISSGNSILENYTIYSITGAKVKVGTESNIVIETLSKGIYIIELTFDTGKLTKKFVK